MFDLSDLPQITFVSPDSRRELRVSQHGAEIERISGIVASLAPSGGTVGLLFQSGPNLVLGWLGVLLSGRVPLILQYPNEKISKQYWKDLLQDTVTRCSVKALLCDPRLADHTPEHLAPTYFLDETHNPEEAPKPLAFPANGQVLQLSSGTTGFKKPVRLDFEALKRHASLYNDVLRLTSEDRVVSWLPLYHDMGFIACFVMPMLLGVPIVMIDPMTWVRQPRLLYDAIQDFRGTICYMPNFGFEVMAKLGQSGPFTSMRHWISCSEPTYPATLERFIQATHADPATISTCYGMAENVFAVAQSAGLRLLEREGRRYVSCGRPVPQTQVKLVDGEFFVRSPYSLSAYDGGEKISDATGFYPTGDLGFMDDGEIVVTGRKQDLANIGGRKYQLNDFDAALGQLFPQSAGRIASLALFDEQSGTEKALFLIEAHNFWEWEHSPDPARLIRDVTGVEWMEVHFVPPHFITKTSSGKINRKRTLQDWLACKNNRKNHALSNAGVDVSGRLAENFPSLLPHKPAQEQLDSLGQLILRIICEEYGVALTPDLTPARIIELATEQTARPETQIFSIIALTDGSRLGLGEATPRFDDAFLQSIEKVVGCPVHFEHICVPPTPIVFSDVIFYDYFLPRNSDPAYGPVASLLGKIRNASIILVDDEDNFRLPPFSAYPILDHQFTPHPDAELLGHRQQRYTQKHHLLPSRVILGRQIIPQLVNISLKNLEDYLGIPVFKMAFHEAFKAHTSHWDFRAHMPFRSDADRLENLSWVERFKVEFLDFVRARQHTCPRRPGEAKNRFVLVDPAHFCSFLHNRMAVDFITRIYNSFCIMGRPSSLPYLQRRLDMLGKPYFFCSQVEPDRDDYECLILTGGVGKMPATNKPSFDFMHARDEQDGGGRPHNVPPEIAHVCPPLAACDEALYRQLLPTHGVLTGNLLLNSTVVRQDPAAQPVPA